jgi:hypothetical protein
MAAKPKEPTHEETLALIAEYGPKDQRVVALGKAYAMLLAARETAVEHWDKLDREIAALKRRFKPGS